VAIVHDAYLISPAAIARVLERWTQEAFDDRFAYRQLRAAALESLDRDEMTRHLADRYGGWDRSSLEAQVPAETPEAVEDFGLWLMMLLYQHFTPSEPPLGLGESWRKATPGGGLERLVRGRPWSDLVDADDKMLNAIRPPRSVGYPVLMFARCSLGSLVLCRPRLRWRTPQRQCLTLPQLPIWGSVWSSLAENVASAIGTSKRCLQGEVSAPVRFCARRSGASHLTQGEKNNASPRVLLDK
jgi:hypothetical protein